MKKWLVAGGIILLVGIVICKVSLFSTRKAFLSLSQSVACEMRTDGLYHYFTDQQIPLVCRKDNQEIGRVEFVFSPEWTPIALFPTKDEQQLLCLYETDLTIALFVIDLARAAGPDHSPPKGLFSSAPPIVKSTTFALRRCTKNELRYLQDLIKSVDDQTLRSWCLSSLPFPNSSREYLLSRVQLVLSPKTIPLAGEHSEVPPEGD